ncbi:LysR family transcriptional regulator [Collimonas sp. OK412]|jgi:DNA-binding transcriptional LysR family regulator|uniref:LysR family transcriptional regulator n=1 Tax=Collimonas sp. (strain OK412) TaxID=1801619 RepID=UPI0008DF85AE|nr:LysR family transcriptional regulator [Collimonas sp. OK412]SFB85812.1 DNA-binding transcriptional regulator, LysR family [Collimonas sp. OK412]
MIDLQRMVAFAAVADHGSFSIAAARLEVSNSHISKQVSALERELRVRLLQRTTRSLSLTEAGELFYRRCKTILSDVAEAEQEVLRRQDSPQGILRVTAPANFANACLPDIICDFMRQHPEIELELTLSDLFFDLAERGIDVALRIATTPPENAHARLLHQIDWSVVGSPGYFATRRQPQALAELPAYDCLADNVMSAKDVWQFEELGGKPGQRHEIGIDPRINCNNSVWLRECVLRGMGIGLLPDYMIGADLAQKKLVKLLPQYAPLPRRRLYGIYLPNRYLSSKVRLFLEAVEQGLQRPA